MKIKQLGIKLLAVIAIVSVFIIGIALSRQSVYKQVFSESCDSVFEKIYLEQKEIKKWKESCLKQAENLSFWVNETQFFRILRKHFAYLDVSHLDINTPAEDKYMWKGIRKETGLEVIGLNGQFYILKSIDPSLGLKFGDQIIAINGDPNVTWQKIKFNDGLFSFLRGQQKIEVNIKTKELKIDEKPILSALSNNIGLLKISSFRPGYFAREKWQEITSKLKNFNSIIIDLRRNSGGNFVAMLRALSPFVCKQKLLGRLGKASAPKSLEYFPDQLSDDIQYELISGKKHVGLQTFEDYGCYSGSVNVLVDEDTASVSEIFAQIIQQEKRGKIIGNITSGQVLLAVWYPILLLGKGYTLSIPEANYYDLEGNSYEGYGVEPDINAYFKIEDLKKGIDSYMQKALLHATE